MSAIGLELFLGRSGVELEAGAVGDWCGDFLVEEALRISAVEPDSRFKMAGDNKLKFVGLRRC